jgi:hypothetical protein
MPRKRYNRPHWSKQSKYPKQRVVKQEKEEENPTPQSAGWKETRNPCGDPEAEEPQEWTSFPDIPSCMDKLYPYIPFKHSVLTLPHKPHRPTTLKQAFRDVVEAIEREIKRREAEKQCDAEKKQNDAWLDSILQKKN